MTDWHDDDKFWEDTAPVLFNEERRKQAPADVEQILGLIKLPSGAAVLDMGCGPGRHALRFAQQGYRVTGVDRTASYLEIARQDAKWVRQPIEWVQADMREFRRENAFDAAVNLFTSFGYFENADDDRRVADNLFASLKPGGHLVMELMGKEVLARIFQPRDWHQEPDGTILLEERRVTADWSWIDVRWIVVHGQRTAEHRFGHRLYSASELKGVLASCGFTALRACGSLEGAPYDHKAERLVILARKHPDRPSPFTRGWSG